MKKSQQTILKMIVPRLFPIVHMRSDPDHLRPEAIISFSAFEKSPSLFIFQCPCAILASQSQQSITKKVSIVKNSAPAAEIIRLQKALSLKNKKIAELESTVALLRAQLVDAEKMIASLQATSLDVLENIDELEDLHELDTLDSLNF